MSGFVTVVSTREDRELGGVVGDMAAAIAHRGDARDIANFSDGCKAIALARPAGGNRVDTWSNDSHAVICDGLLGNARELRARAGCDENANNAELMLAGFLSHGADFFAEVDGAFAVQIVDLRAGRIFLVRDRFANRSLYFAIANQQVFVASEIKALLASGRLDRTVCDDQLAFVIGNGFTIGPRTLIRNVFQLPPGFVFEIDTDGSFKATDCLRPVVNTQTNLSVDDAKAFILDALSKSVQQIREACGPAAIMLSGGVDSALIAYVAQRESTDNLFAVSFGAEDWRSDESGFAGELAERLDMPFQRSYLPLVHDFPGVIRKVVTALEEPTRFENGVAMYAASSEASKNGTVLLTGEGADYLLGSKGHKVSGWISQLNRIPSPLRAMARALHMESLPLGKLSVLGSLLRWESVSHYVVAESTNCLDLVPGAKKAPPTEVEALLATDVSQYSPSVQYILATLREASAAWVGRMEKISAAAGLECFHPFGTNDMLQFGLDLPDRLRYANGESKPAVRQLAAELCGDDVAYRQKRQFAAPMQLWLNRSDKLRDAVLSLKDPGCRYRAYLDNDVVNRYLDQYERNGADDEGTAVHVFRLLTFEYWLESFID